MRIHIAGLAFIMVVAAGSAPAATIASSDFSTGTDGWTNGDFRDLTPTTPVSYNSIAQNIFVHDNYGYNSLVAPSAYLGDLSAAFGGSISFSLSDNLNDGFAYAPLVLISGSTHLYGTPTVIPSSDAGALTHYTFTLRGSNFSTTDLGGGTVSDLDLLHVLTNLQRIGVNADWYGGADGYAEVVTLDSVSLCDANGCDAVRSAPEPSTWGMLILGIAGVGVSLRRHPRRRPWVA